MLVWLSVCSEVQICIWPRRCHCQRVCVLIETTRVSRYQKGKAYLDFTEARDSGISWAICKSAPRSRQITTPAPHHSFLQTGCPSCRPTNIVKAQKAFSPGQRAVKRAHACVCVCTGGCSRRQVPQWAWRWRAQRRPSETLAVRGRSCIHATSSQRTTRTWTERRRPSDWWPPRRQPVSAFYHPPTTTPASTSPINSTHYATLYPQTGQLGSRVVSVLDSVAEGPGFKSQPRCCRITVLGKLFTPILLLLFKQQNW